MAPPPADPATAPHRPHVKETLISIIIAFALAFVFRGFVIEAFLIPTGSMAPTLMGQHIRVADARDGYSWPASTTLEDTWPDPTSPLPFQGRQAIPGRGTTPPIRIANPLTRQDLPEMHDVPRRAGDRIFVMKYLASIYDPQRFDVVVFKNPTDPQVNFIKRLIGLPGEQIAIVDGDVFTRTPEPTDPSSANPWLLPGWRVASKPERAQRAMWQPVFDSDFEPRPAAAGSYRRPWGSHDAGWSFTDRAYAFAGPGPTTLSWDAETPIRDAYAYDETIRARTGSDDKFPVADLRIEFTVETSGTDLTISSVIEARGHAFRADIQGTSAVIRMRPVGSEGEWTVLGKGTLRRGLVPGRPVRLEFWHADQGLSLWEEDEPVIPRVEYSWSPAERLMRSTLLGAEWAKRATEPALLTNPQIYIPPRVRLECSGGAFTLHRLALSRDIYYQPGLYGGVNSQGLPHSRSGTPSLATHPASTLSLSRDEFFCVGDNSPSSLDGRLWDAPDPWVRVIDDKIGVVHRDLLIGKAFFVYFPAPNWRGKLPIPDFGRMRWIW